MSNELVLYDKMRLAIKQCAAVDEAAGIRDTAIRIQAYAKIRDDFESQQRFAEIRLRACQRIGEISRDLEKAQYNKGHGTVVPSDGKYKAEVLAEAGISTSTAQRYEELAGPMIDLIDPKEATGDELLALADSMEAYGNNCIERARYIRELGKLRKKRGL
jgi:hypothetical protein